MELKIEYFKNNEIFPLIKNVFKFNRVDLTSIIKSYKLINDRIYEVDINLVAFTKIKVQIKINHIVEKIMCIPFEEVGNLYDYLKALNKCLKNTYDYNYNFKFGGVDDNEVRWLYYGDYGDSGFHYVDSLFSSFDGSNDILCVDKNNKEITIYIPQIKK